MLSEGRFDRLLSADSGVGQHLAWMRAQLCPCRNMVTGAAKQGCPNCAGRGVIWAAPVCAWSGVASQRITRQWEAFGMYELGDMVLTIPSDSPFYAAGEFDRAVMTDSSEPFSAIQIRGQEKINFPIVSVDAVLWLDPVTQAQIQGAIPAINQGGLTWLPPLAEENGILIQAEDGSQLTIEAWPDAPPIGTQYAIRGRKQPEYFLYRDFPQDRAHYGGTPLPRRVVMRRFDLFKR